MPILSCSASLNWPDCHTYLLSNCYHYETQLFVYITIAYCNTFTTFKASKLIPSKLIPILSKTLFFCYKKVFGTAQDRVKLLAWFSDLFTATQTSEMCGRESTSTFHHYNQNLYASGVAGDLFWLSVGVQTRVYEEAGADGRGERPRKPLDPVSHFICFTFFEF